MSLLREACREVAQPRRGLLGREWMAARQEWIDAGNQWPGGEVAEFDEVLRLIIATPDEPFDWDEI
ncbi:hypothetical protein IU486_08685 [Streptomyces gardneri]|nr:hypothetical protein [Streptomyces gardneri]